MKFESGDVAGWLDVVAFPVIVLEAVSVVELVREDVEIANVDELIRGVLFVVSVVELVRGGLEVIVVDELVRGEVEAVVVPLDKGRAWAAFCNGFTAWTFPPAGGALAISARGDG